MLLVAIRDVARARGMTHLAKDSAFGEKVCTKRWLLEPIRAMILKVVKALGVRLHAEAA